MTIAVAISFAAIFWWTLGEGRTHQPVPKEAQRTVWLQFSIGGVVYIVAIGIAFLSAPLALALIGLVALYYMFEQTPQRSRRS